MSRHAANDLPSPRTEPHTRADMCPRGACTVEEARALIQVSEELCTASENCRTDAPGVPFLIRLRGNIKFREEVLEHFNALVAAFRHLA